jgi:hypothetical protein
MGLFSRKKDEPDDCLSGFTTDEFRQAAERLDQGDDSAAQALVGRAGPGHGRCAAMGVFRFVRVDAE